MKKIYVTFRDSFSWLREMSVHFEDETHWWTTQLYFTEDLNVSLCTIIERYSKFPCYWITDQTLITQIEDWLEMESDQMPSSF